MFSPVTNICPWWHQYSIAHVCGQLSVTLGSLGFTKPDDKPIHTEEISLISSVEICSPGRFSFKMSEPWVLSSQTYFVVRARDKAAGQATITPNREPKPMASVLV